MMPLSNDLGRIEVTKAGSVLMRACTPCSSLEISLLELEFFRLKYLQLYIIQIYTQSPPLKKKDSSALYPTKPLEEAILLVNEKILQILPSKELHVCICWKKFPELYIYIYIYIYI
jgi:hypothetical protein